jgi:putative drug exporter of the RND superfamily
MVFTVSYMNTSLARSSPVPPTVVPLPSDQGLGRLARSLLRHRKLVGLLWLAIAITGLALIGPISGRLTSSTTFPGLPSYQAGLAIEHAYGNGGSNEPTVALVTLPAGQRVTSPDGLREVTSAFAALESDHALRVVSYATVHDPRLVSPDGRSAIAVIFGGADQPTSSQLAGMIRGRGPAGVTVAATSLNDLYNAPGNGGVGVLGEAAIGAIGALLVLILVFGSFLAVVPLIIAAVSILTTFLLIGAITTVTDVSELVEYLVALIGLGVAVDYSLLIVSRWRDERTRGRNNDDAVVVAMSTAGRAVAFSGATVGVGLLTLVLLPIPFLRSLGYGGLLIPLVTVMAAVTLLPVLLSAWGPRLDRRSRRAGRRAARRSGGPSQRWVTWTQAVIRHRLLAIGTAAVILGILLTAAFGLKAGEARSTSLARSGSAEQGLQAIQHAGFPVGVISPIEILVPDRTSPGALATDLAAIPGVDTAVAPTGPAWRRDGTAVVDVLPSAPTSSVPDKATVAAVRATVARTAPGAKVAGDGPDEADVVNAYYSRFPLIVAIVALISVIALTRAFRSIVLAVKAVVLNMLSVGAVYGVLVLIWQRGYGSHVIWGIPATGVVIDFVPLLVFAFLFGLSMDYEVFILSRVKEAHDAGQPTDDAIAEGLGHTGRLVTSAAIILFLAFFALASGPNVPLKMFATAMAVGILLDSTVVRALLVPALVSGLGRWSWWPDRSRPASQPDPSRAEPQAAIR